MRKKKLVGSSVALYAILFFLVKEICKSLISWFTFRHIINWISSCQVWMRCQWTTIKKQWNKEDSEEKPLEQEESIMSNASLINIFLSKVSEKKLKVCCVGDAMVDEYFQVKVNRISPEFPMPIMQSSADKYDSRPGGVANVAYQFKHFNVDVDLICLMHDENAVEVFESHGLKLMHHLPHLHGCKLPRKRRFLDGDIQVVRHDLEMPNCNLDAKALEHLSQVVKQLLKSKAFDVLIFSDYDKGFFKDQNLDLESISATTIVDPKKGPLSKWCGCNIFKPNSKEAEELSGFSDWKEQASFFKNYLNCQSVVITDGGTKVCGIDKDEYFCYKPSKSVEVASVVGAGDCFCAFLAMAVGQGFAVPDAAKIAWEAGSIYVQNKLNRPIVAAELVDSKIVDPSFLTHRDFKLVFTNGCFDLLHEGHLQTLRFAKSKGEKLVVALNSDASIKRLKGDSRPIKPLRQRAAVMAALNMVDFVVIFEDDTPEGILRTIQPDVLVKGGDYEIDQIVGSDFVKEIYRAPMVENISTTYLLQSHDSQSH